ncbi:radical SAM protein [Thermodesulfovibrionales bacterium]|nr:radical SAM protein [Thermodesulfovibrionales bacterium]
MIAFPDPDFSVVHNWKHSASHYPIATSRGCPFGCKFCSVIQMLGRTYRFKSVEATLRELKNVTSVSKANSLKFIVDDSFTANKRRTKEILNGMIAEGIKTRWSAQVRTDVAKDPEFLSLMADADCNRVYVGLESINPKTLEAYNKNQSVEDIIDYIKAVKEHGIHIHGMFVLGADDLDTIKKTADFAIKLDIDTVQFMMLTPLPGTPLFLRYKRSRKASTYRLEQI